MSDSYAQNAKNFLLQNTQGVLSTQSVKYPGFPFGSVVPYDIREDDRISIFISTLASHYKNLKASPKACLTVKDAFGASDPQAHSRISLLLEFSATTSSDEQEEIKTSYLERFEFAKQYEGFHDFFFYVGRIRYVRWIAGFGEMGWLDAEALERAHWDSVAYQSAPAIAHMNQDHSDALCDFARYYGDGLRNETDLEVTMVSLTRAFFRLQVAHRERIQYVTVPFEQELKDSAEVRSAIVSLLRRCRAELSHE